MNAKSRRIRHVTFAVVMVLYYVVYACCGACEGNARPMYAVKIVMESACLCLFLWFWLLKGIASTVYAWIVTLFAGMIYSDSVEYYGRSLAQTQHIMIPFQTSPWWITRDVPILLVLAFMLAFILGRIFGEEH